MFAIIEVSSGQAMKMVARRTPNRTAGRPTSGQGGPTKVEITLSTAIGDPALFDTELEAAEWATAWHLDGREYAVVDTDDILNEEA